MSNSIDQQCRPAVSKPRHAVLVAETRCVLGTLAMLARSQIAMPNGRVGQFVMFADGTCSEIYRETALRNRQSAELVLLAVRFRLRLIGHSRFGHFLFRMESVLNTLLFAAHRGFQTKLWLTDRATGFYRGIYEWTGQAAAIEYLETLRVVLAPWVEPGSFAYEVVEGISRVEFLEGMLEEGSDGPGGGWWRPVATRPQCPSHA